MLSWLGAPDHSSAASGTWTGAVDGNWAAAGNWSASPVPGTGETATFDNATGGHPLISLGSGVTAAGIRFTGSAGFTIGAGAAGSQILTLNHTGEIRLMDFAGADQIINSSVVLGTNANASNYYLSNSHDTRSLTIAGPVTGGTGGTAGAKNLRLDAFQGNMVVSGAIGGGGGTISLAKTGAGTAFLTGTSTFTGSVSINAGTLAVPVVNNSGTAGPLGAGTSPVSLSTPGAYGKLACTGPAAASTRRLTIAASIGGEISVDAPGTELTLTGVIDGVGPLVKSGPGTLTLGGANTFPGLTVNEGTLRLTGTGTPGAATGPILVAGRMELNGRPATAGSVASTPTGIIANGGATDCTLTVNSAVFRNVDGTVRDTTGTSAGKLSLTKSGTGGLVLTGNNSYSGNTLISGGYISCFHAGALGSATAGTTVSSGATLWMRANSAEPVTISGTGAAGEDGAFTGFGGITYGGLLTLAAAARLTTFPYGPPATSPPFVVSNPGTITGAFALTLAGTAPGEMNSAIGTASLTKTGPSVWTLQRGNLHAGATGIAQGILRIRHGSALGTVTGNTSITAGATLQIEGGITTLAEPLTVRGTGDPGASGALENVSGDNTWSGLLTLGADSTLSSAAGLLTLSHTGSITGAGFDLTLTGAGDGRIQSVIATGAGLVNKNGSGTWALAGLNTFTGRTTVNEGLLEVTTLKNVSGGASSLGAPATAANGTISLGSGTASGGLRFVGTADAVSNRVINLAGTTGGAVLDSSSPTHAKLVLTGAITATGAGDKTLTLTGTSGGAGEISGVIPNSAGFRTAVSKAGGGTWILSGAGTYTGSTRVSGGILTLPGAGLADTSDVVLVTGGILNLTFSGSDTVARLYLDGMPQAAGTWGGPASAAANRTPLLSGTGVLNVTSGPGPGSYPVWAAGHSLTGPAAAFDADPDGDGIANGFEWMSGSDPAMPDDPLLTLHPWQNGYSFAFRRTDAAETGIALFLRHTTDLQSWIEIPILITPGTVTDPDSGIQIVVSEYGELPDLIEVFIPATAPRRCLQLKAAPAAP